jgi:HlyD family secretion protein
MKLPQTPPLYRQGEERRGFPWGKIIYLAILAILLGSLGWWGWRRVIYIEAPALVQGREVQIQSSETGRIEAVTVEIGDQVTPEMVVARLNVTRRGQDQWSPETAARLRESLQRVSGEAAVLAKELSLKSSLAAAYDRERRRSRQLLEQHVLKYGDYKKMDLEIQAKQTELGQLKKRLAVLHEEKRLLEEIYQQHLPPHGAVCVELTAHTGGCVIQRNRQPGEVVLAGQPVVTLVDLRQLHVKAFLPEKFQPDITLGEKSVILLKDGSMIPGKVVKLYPATEHLPPEYQKYYMTRQQAIIAEILPDQNDPEKLLHGLPATVRFSRQGRFF